MVRAHFGSVQSACVHVDVVNVDRSGGCTAGMLIGGKRGAGVANRQVARDVEKEGIGVGIAAATEGEAGDRVVGIQLGHGVLP